MIHFIDTCILKFEKEMTEEDHFLARCIGLKKRFGGYVADLRDVNQTALKEWLKAVFPEFVKSRGFFKTELMKQIKERYRDLAIKFDFDHLNKLDYSDRLKAHQNECSRFSYYRQYTIWRLKDLNGVPVTNCNVPGGTYVNDSSFTHAPPTNVNIMAEMKVGGPFNPAYPKTAFNNPPSVYPSVYQDQMEVDYIRIYQRTPQQGFTDLCATATVSGPPDICNLSPVKYTFVGPHNVNATWTYSSNLTVVASDSLSITVKANSINSSQAWVRADFTNPYPPCTQTQYTANIWLGAPILPSFATVPPAPMCYGSTATCSLSSNSSALSYSWHSALPLTPSGSTCQIQAQTAGNYQINVQAVNNCGISPIRTVSAQVVMTGPSCRQKIEIFPNPSSDKVNVVSDNLQLVELYNLLGEKIYQWKGDEGEMSFNVESLPSGMYFLIVDGVKRIFVKP